MTLKELHQYTCSIYKSIDPERKSHKRYKSKLKFFAVTIERNEFGKTTELKINEPFFGIE